MNEHVPSASEPASDPPRELRSPSPGSPELPSGRQRLAFASQSKSPPLRALPGPGYDAATLSPRVGPSWRCSLRSDPLASHHVGLPGPWSRRRRWRMAALCQHCVDPQKGGFIAEHES